MEERKTKAMKVLSKLQDDAPCQPNRSHERSKFEDCEFFKTIMGLFCALKRDFGRFQPQFAVIFQHLDRT